MSLILTLVLVLLALYLLWSRAVGQRNRHPPGPSRLPLLGSVHHLSQEYQHKKLAELAETYGLSQTSIRGVLHSLSAVPGDVMYLQLFRWPAVVLNSVQAAQDLFEKRSSIYSDRPRFTLVAEYVYSDAEYTLSLIAPQDGL